MELSSPLLARKLLILSMLVYTNMKLKEVLNLKIKQFKQLLKFCLFEVNKISRKIYLEAPYDAHYLENYLESVSKGKTEKDYVFTTITNTRKPLYVSNIRKELSVLVFSIIQDSENEINLSDILYEKMFS